MSLDAHLRRALDKGPPTPDELAYMRAVLEDPTRNGQIPRALNYRLVLYVHDLERQLKEVAPTSGQADTPAWRRWRRR